MADKISHFFTNLDKYATEIADTLRNEVIYIKIKNNSIIEAEFYNKYDNKKYYTFIDIMNRVIHCDCEAFVYNKACKHIRAIAYLIRELFIKQKPLGLIRRFNLTVVGYVDYQLNKFVIMFYKIK